MPRIDVTAVIMKVVEVLPNFLPRPKPPVTDYSEIIAALPHVQYPSIQSVTLDELKTQEIPIPQIITKPQGGEAEKIEATLSVEKAAVRGEPVSTACLSCSRSHLATIAGGLGEAVRFARGDPQGILHPEVVMRVQKAEEEIGIMERIDLSPEALLASPPEEKEVAEQYLPRIRKLRQGIGDMGSFEDLEQVAADASMLGQEFRLRHLQLKGVDLNPVVELAQRVQKGELSIEEAKAQLKDLLPEDE